MNVIAIPRRRVKVAMDAMDRSDWVNMAAGSALVVGGLLLFTKRRRAGAAVAAVGTALALVEHRDVVESWWHRLPQIADRVQSLVHQVQEKANEFSARRDSMMESVASLGESPELLRKED